MDYNNDPRLIEEVHSLRADNASLFNQINSFRELNDFLKQVITTLISSR